MTAKVERGKLSLFGTLGKYGTFAASRSLFPQILPGEELDLTTCLASLEVSFGILFLFLPFCWIYNFDCALRRMQRRLEMCALIRKGGCTINVGDIVELKETIISRCSAVGQFFLIFSLEFSSSRLVLCHFCLFRRIDRAFRMVRFGRG